MTAREEAVRTADLATCDCDPCKRKKGLPHGVHSLAMHSYSSQPSRGWLARKTAADRAAERETGNPTPTLGVELETAIQEPARIPELPGCPIVHPLSHHATDDEVRIYCLQMNEWRAWRLRNDRHIIRAQERQTIEGAMTADEAVSMAAPRGLWHVKHDSSVTGPEFASHPATLAYWHKARPYLTSMFKSLLHGGVRSHDGDTCGLHINIGTDAFDDAGHLARFAEMVVHNPRWSMRMSQRTQHSANHWARFGNELDSDLLDDWAYRVMRYGYASQNRYCVLNASNQGRIEFRLPRGTLRIDRFYAKLEWTAAMVEYTRDSGHLIQVSAFIRWAQEVGKYPALMSFMREKFRGRFEEMAAPEPEMVPELDEPDRPIDPDLLADVTAEPDEGTEERPQCSCGDGCPDGECLDCNSEPELCNSRQPDGSRYYCELWLGHSGQHGYPDVGVYWDDIEQQRLLAEMDASQMLTPTRMAIDV